MKFITAVSLLASIAMVQSTSPIPTGISSECSTFLTEFDNASNMTSCTSSLITATSAFAPSSNATAATNATSASVTSALAQVCSSTTCDTSIIRSALANFYEACGDELTTSPNADVLRTYDVLYGLVPFKQAVCSKDDSGNYCITDVASTTSESSTVLANIRKYIYVPVSSTVSRRDDAQAVASIAPNTTTFAQNNLMFLLLQSGLSSSALCQTCTRNVLTSYISFESSTPYAPGLGASSLLSGQTDLYSAVTNTCASNFLSGGVAAAAGLSGGLLGSDSNGASHAMLANTGVAGVMVGALALALSTVF